MGEERDGEPMTRIKVIGIGGGGGNAINNMVRSGLCGVEYLAINTDGQDLRRSLAPSRLHLGAHLTKGIGAGGDPEVGREAALEDRDRLAELIAGADLVFITAGMGGGTGTGAAPIACEVARELGCLTVGVVTRPFAFEGERRRLQAEDGIANMLPHVDILITISNHCLFAVTDDRTLVAEALGMVDDMVLQAVKGVADVINYQGLVNIDFADVRSILQDGGHALMGVGIDLGEHRAIEATRKAISSPFLDGQSIDGATSVLMNFTGSSSLTLHEVNEAASMALKKAAKNANVIVGLIVDESMGGTVRITILATGARKAVRRTPTFLENLRALLTAFIRM